MEQQVGVGVGEISNQSKRLLSGSHLFKLFCLQLNVYLGFLEKVAVEV